MKDNKKCYTSVEEHDITEPQNTQHTTKFQNYIMNQ
jgi:hypothetical protein